MNQAVAESELAGRAVAPRVSQSDVDAAVLAVAYHTFPGTMLTVCVVTLQNGFTVVGESACASPENFQKDIGARIARENALRKVWPLLGYALRDHLHRMPKGVAPIDAAAAPGEHPLDRIARVCHEVNRAYCQALGDDSQTAWLDAPEWQRASARMGVDLHIMGDFGPAASHEAWMTAKLNDGWQYGAVKDADAKTHPCIVPFDELPQAQQAKDYIFRAVAHALK